MKQVEKKLVPTVLNSLIDRWIGEGDDFFLSWEKCTAYKGKIIKFLYEDEQLTNPDWYIKYGNPDCEKELSKEKIQEIAMELVKYYDTIRWSLIVDWHCNYECNMCPFHGTGTENGKSMALEETRPVMSKEMAFDIIDRFYEKGIKIVTLMSDGEIFLYKHWQEVSKYISDKGMSIWTITNGSLVTEEVCKILKELNYTDIRVSLDAYEFETYSKIRSKNRNYFENAMKAPLLLKKYGITTNVHFVKQEENIHEVDQFLEYWKNQNVDSISIANQLVFGEETCYNKFAQTVQKEYIQGLCSAYGNFQTLQNGSTRFCCGTGNFNEDLFNDKFPGLYAQESKIQDIISSCNAQMSIPNSPMAKVCSRCALYVPYTEVEKEGNWIIKKNTERETWIRNIANK